MIGELFIFSSYGYNTWRNPLRPSQILQNLCSDVGYPPPQYLSNSISLEGHTFHADSADELLLENEAGIISMSIFYSTK